MSAGRKAVASALVRLELIKSVERNIGAQPGALGLGNGTTDEGIRLAALGYLSERLREAEQANSELSPPLGRPANSPLEDVDIQRALLLCSLAHTIAAIREERKVDPSIPANISAREMIGLLQSAGSQMFGGMTSAATVEQSVSRGRRKLGIGRSWTAPDLRKILEEFLTIHGEMRGGV